MITILIGKSASGKDTMLKKNTLKTIVTHTTRPKRPGEKDGIDYVFVDKDKFLLGLEEDKYIEYRKYNTCVGGNPDTWYYGSPRVNPEDDYTVILDIDGAYAYIDAYGAENIKITEIRCSDSVREERAKKRPGFDRSEWDRRLKDDNVKFSDERLSSLKKRVKKYVVINNENDMEVSA